MQWPVLTENDPAWFLAFDKYDREINESATSIGDSHGHGHGPTVTVTELLLRPSRQE